ncbi:MAG: NUDIX domain-containing protein [Actinobacteria bacterium]|jgi:ADP-ribose pyrophosphatase YjhB (NUDIX family)|nr:NUDIX domain-containing protein [Actinomycetota bacterium]
MARSGHVAEIRALVGSHRLLLPSVGTAVFHEDRILLVRHADGTHRWGLPGGAVEPGEHPADAAAREVFEETGLEVEIAALAGVFSGPDAEVHYDNGDVTVYVTSVFTARPRRGTQPRIDRNELADAAWFGSDELPSRELPRHAAEAVAAALSIHFHGGAARFVPGTWHP